MRLFSFLAASLLALTGPTGPTPLRPPDRPSVSWQASTASDHEWDRLADEIRWQQAVDLQTAQDAWYAEVDRQQQEQAAKPVEANVGRSPVTPAVLAYQGSIPDLIRSIFGTESAVRVADCESTLNPAAVSPGGGNLGLFQLNRVHATDFETVTGVPFSQGWSDPYLNTLYAKHLYDESGWGPWTCRYRA